MLSLLASSVEVVVDIAAEGVGSIVTMRVPELESGPPSNALCSAFGRGGGYKIDEDILEAAAVRLKRRVKKLASQTDRWWERGRLVGCDSHYLFIWIQ